MESQTFDALRNEPGSIAIVVSPLVALMKDQAEAMKKRGISAVYVGDSRGHDITTKISSGTFQVVYLSLESLLTNDTWRDMLQTPTLTVRDHMSCVLNLSLKRKWYCTRSANASIE